MGATLSDGLKIGIAIVIVCAIVATIVVVVAIVMRWNSSMSEKMDVVNTIENSSDFVAMAVYGEPIPMPNVVATLDLRGVPYRLCVQLEDLRGKMGGNPYPEAVASDTEAMNKLITALREHYDKKVYVYTYTDEYGDLQLCISELPHTRDTPAWEQ